MFISKTRTNDSFGSLGAETQSNSERKGILMGTTLLEFPGKTAFLIARKLEAFGISVSYATESELVIRNRDRKNAFALIRRDGEFFVEREYNYIPID